jgi:hypothetical protein
MASRALPPNRVLDAFHTVMSGGLIALSAAGLSAIAYGVYRIKIVMPVEVPRLKAAAEAAAAGQAAAPAPPAEAPKA